MPEVAGIGGGVPVDTWHTAAAVVGADEPSPIDAGLVALDSAIGNCARVIESLVERLGPVLGDYSSDGEKDENAAMPRGSVVAVRLMDIRAKVDRLTNELTTALVRLEV